MNVFQTLEARGFVKQCTDPDEVQRRLSEEQVTFYVGIDPTADSMHVGHLVPVMALAHLQRAGHRPILVMGGGTAMVGDPSGKSEMRQMLTVEQIDANGEALKTQLSRFVDFGEGKARFLNNAEWIRPLNYVEFLRDIGKHFSINRMLTMESVKQRLERGLSFIEFNYQLLQAYDFLELNRRYECSLQIGGDDQWGNIVAGIDLVRREMRNPSFGLTQPLITTSTGAKMGKTAKGAVWLDEKRFSAFDYYQYWLNVDDLDVGRFLRLYTFMPIPEIEVLEALEGADVRQAKAVLAFEATRLAHGEDAANAAKAGAVAMVSATGSDNLPTHELAEGSLGEGLKIYVALADAGLTKSNGEGRRLIKNGGVRLNGEKVDDAEQELGPEHIIEGSIVLRLGKKRSIRLVVS